MAAEWGLAEAVSESLKENIIHASGGGSGCVDPLARENRRRRERARKHAREEARTLAEEGPPGGNVNLGLAGIGMGGPVTDPVTGDGDGGQETSTHGAIDEAGGDGEGEGGGKGQDEGKGDAARERRRVGLPPMPPRDPGAGIPGPAPVAAGLLGGVRVGQELLNSVIIPAVAAAAGGDNGDDGEGTVSEEEAEAARWLPPSGGAAGSNWWVVNGKGTDTGRPVLANDPHLSVTIPLIWYDNHLRVEPAAPLDGGGSAGGAVGDGASDGANHGAGKEGAEGAKQGMGP
eukprot:jgi/Mesvir1/24846/Mv22082-RA.1